MCHAEHKITAPLDPDAPKQQVSEGRGHWQEVGVAWRGAWRQ